MITIKSAREIEAMDHTGSVLASLFEKLRGLIKPGITTMEINDYFQEEAEKEGAVLEEIGFEGYPYATCTSVNDEICHAFPDENVVLKEGDIVSVDSVISIDGFMSDSCYTYAVGQVSPEVQQLMDVTKNCVYLGIEQARDGNRIGDIGHAIQEYAESFGYGVVREFGGHGIQPTMHEDPFIPHYGKAGRGTRLKSGMTICIEPMITMGGWKAQMDDNGWTARTVDGSWCAQYEHTVAILPEGPKILTMQRPDKGDDRLEFRNLAIDFNAPDD